MQANGGRVQVAQQLERHDRVGGNLVGNDLELLVGAQQVEQFDGQHAVDIALGRVPVFPAGDKVAGKKIKAALEAQIKFVKAVQVIGQQMQLALLYRAAAGQRFAQAFNFATIKAGRFQLDVVGSQCQRGQGFLVGDQVFFANYPTVGKTIFIQHLELGENFFGL